MTATPKWRQLPPQAITAEQHAEITARLDRPLTDRPIGATTQARRDIDAQSSAAHTERDTAIAEVMSQIIVKRQPQPRRKRAA